MDNIVIGGYRQLTRNVDQSKQIIITPWGQECHFDEIGKLLNMDFLKHKFEFAEKMKTLDLSVQEEAVMRAIVIYQPTMDVSGKKYIHCSDSRANISAVTPRII